MEKALLGGGLEATSSVLFLLLLQVCQIRIKVDLNPSAMPVPCNENIEGFNKKGHQN